MNKGSRMYRYLTDAEKRVEEIDHAMDSLEKDVDVVNKYIRKEEKAWALMEAKLKKERLVALTAVSKFKLLIAEMEIFITESELNNTNLEGPNKAALGASEDYFSPIRRTQSYSRSSFTPRSYSRRGSFSVTRCPGNRSTSPSKSSCEGMSISRFAGTIRTSPKSSAGIHNTYRSSSETNTPERIIRNKSAAPCSKSNIKITKKKNFAKKNVAKKGITKKNVAKKNVAKKNIFKKKQKDPLPKSSISTQRGVPEYNNEENISIENDTPISIVSAGSVRTASKSSNSQRSPTDSSNQSSNSLRLLTDSRNNSSNSQRSPRDSPNIISNSQRFALDSSNKSSNSQRFLTDSSNKSSNSPRYPTDSSNKCSNSPRSPTDSSNKSSNSQRFPTDSSNQSLNSQRSPTDTSNKCLNSQRYPTDSSNKISNSQKYPTDSSNKSLNSQRSPPTDSSNNILDSQKSPTHSSNKISNSQRSPIELNSSNNSSNSRTSLTESIIAEFEKPYTKVIDLPRNSNHEKTPLTRKLNARALKKRKITPVSNIDAYKKPPSQMLSINSHILYAPPSASVPPLHPRDQRTLHPRDPRGYSRPVQKESSITETPMKLPVPQMNQSRQVPTQVRQNGEMRQECKNLPTWGVNKVRIAHTPTSAEPAELRHMPILASPKRVKQNYIENGQTGNHIEHTLASSHIAQTQTVIEHRSTTQNVYQLQALGNHTRFPIPPKNPERNKSESLKEIRMYNQNHARNRQVLGQSKTPKLNHSLNYLPNVEFNSTPKYMPRGNLSCNTQGQHTPDGPKRLCFYNSM